MTNNFAVEIGTPIKNIPYLNSKASPHGGYRKIPGRYKKYPVIMVVRNPLDRYVSRYLFGWWKENCPERTKEYFPNFPDLDFEEFVEFSKFVARQKTDLGNISEDIGEATISFAYMATSRPEQFLEEVSAGSDLENFLDNYIGDLRLIDQSNLSDNLFSVLSEFHDPVDLEFIRGMGRIQPKRGTVRSEWENIDYYYDENLRKKVEEEDSYYLDACRLLGVEF